MLVSIPAFVAADFGGVLPWTLWATSVATLVVLGLLIPSLILGKERTPLSSHAVGGILISFAILGFAQAVTVPSVLLATVAPGSFDAYTNWLAPLKSVAGDAILLEGVRPMVTIDASLTHVAAWTTLLVGSLAIIASLLIAGREKLQLFLIVLAVTGALHAVFGLCQSLINPTATIWGVQSSGGNAPFGTFINRSNAAVLLNAGLAGSLGLIAWRLAALTGATFNNGRLVFSEILDIFFDRTFGFALITGALTVIGLLTCGSRSGFIGFVGGMMLALGIVQSSHRIRGLVPTVLGFTVIAVIAMLNFDLTAKTTQRITESIEQTAETSSLSDGRFDHWPDAVVAAARQPILGWGWGAYRYAYLPFQKSSPASWFVNADNLWLEIIVETGIVGFSLLAITLLIVVRALIKLDNGSEPLDHGIATAGWYLLGAVLLSQFFDFGLRLPGNSILVAMLFSVVVARSNFVAVQTRDRTNETSNRIRKSNYPRLDTSWLFKRIRERGFKNRFDNPLLIVMPLAILTALTGIQFHQYAHNDFASRLARAGIGSQDVNEDDLQHAVLLITHATQTEPHDSLTLVQAAQLKLISNRRHAAEKMTMENGLVEYETALAALSPVNLRKFAFQPWQDSEANRHLVLRRLQNALGDHLSNALNTIAAESVEARRLAVKALIASPLSPEARLALVSLDFAGGNAEQSGLLLQQAAVLRKQNPQVLVHIGDLSAEIENHSLAATAWKRSIVLNKNFTKQVMQRADRTDQISVNQIIPASIAAIVQAAPIEMKKANPDSKFLIQAIEDLKTNLPPENKSKSEQLRIAARIEHRLGRTSDCAKTLTLATTFMPSDIDLRHEHAVALLRDNQLAQARESARIGRELSSDKQRFEKLIASIATKIQEIDQQ